MLGSALSSPGGSALGVFAGSANGWAPSAALIPKLRPPGEHARKATGAAKDFSAPRIQRASPARRFDRWLSLGSSRGALVGFGWLAC